MTNQLNGRNVAILVTDGFEQIELTSPREVLEKGGAKCMIVSPKSGEVQGFKHYDKADKFKVDLQLSKANADDFDAVLLPGGVINADALRIEKKAQQFVQEINRTNKPIMVICHGPWLLISAGIVNGRRLTSYPTLQDDLRNAGAKWEDNECVHDRNFVSSRKSDDLPAFNREIVKALGEFQPSKTTRPQDYEKPSARP